MGKELGSIRKLFHQSVAGGGRGFLSPAGSRNPMATVSLDSRKGGEEIDKEIRGGKRKRELSCCEALVSLPDLSRPTPPRHLDFCFAAY